MRGKRNGDFFAPLLVKGDTLEFLRYQAVDKSLCCYLGQSWNWTPDNVT